MWAMKAYNHAEVYFNVSEQMNEWMVTIYPAAILEHLNVQFNWQFLSPQLISSVEPKFLKLTKSDEQIYTKFREAFPDLSIGVLDPDQLKSADAKEVWDVTFAREMSLLLYITQRVCQALFQFCFQKWRPFCNQFEGVVDDFNYGTLLRLDCQKDYTEENTIFGMQCHTCTHFRNRSVSFQ